MKKGLVVLLIAVLASALAFADISGTVTAAYKFDFEAETIDYSVAGTNAKLTWSWNSQDVTSAGSDMPYASVKVGLEAASTVAKNLVAGWTFDNGYKVSPSNAVNVTLTLEEFKIVGENWTVDFLGAEQFGDYAKSAWEVTSSKKVALDFKNINTDGLEGVTVTYNDISVGIHASYDGADELSHVVASTETPEFEFEGGSAQAALAVSHYKHSDFKSNSIAASAKADYTVSDVELSLAADMDYVFTNDDANDNDFNADVAFAASYKPVAIDFYFASLLTEDADGYATPADYDDDENILSVRAIFDVAEVAEDVAVKVTAKAENLLNDSKIISAEAEVGMVENLTLTVGYNDMLGKYSKQNKQLFVESEYTGIENVTLEANAYYSIGNKVFDADATVTYAFEKADVFGAVAFEKADGADALFAGRVGAQSTAIVDNATIGADLVFNKNSLFDTDDYAASNYLSAYCKVSF